MTKRKPLEWYGDDDSLVGWPLCDECVAYMSRPGMVEACASVGIEHGKSTGQMLREVVNEFHARRHEEGER